MMKGSADICGTLNDKRRHLNESQRALVGANIANMQCGNPNRPSGPFEKEVSNLEAAKMMNSLRTGERKDLTSVPHETEVAGTETRKKDSSK